MNLDCTKFPDDHTFAEEAGRALGVYVSVADFTEWRGRRMFRLVMDGVLDRRQLRELMFSTVRDHLRTYEFSHVEVLAGPIVDQAPARSQTTTYIRATFM